MKAVVATRQRGRRIGTRGPIERRTRSVRLLVWTGVIVLVLKALRVRGGYAYWLELAGAFPVLLALGLPSYRHHLIGVARRLWGRLGEYRTTRSRLPWASALAFAILPAALLNLSNGRTLGAGDTHPAMLTAISLVTRGDPNLDEFARSGYVWKGTGPTGRLAGFYTRRGGHIYSRYPAGMVTFALPVAALSRLVGGQLDEPRTPLRLEKITAALVGAFGVGLFFLIALHLAPPAPALVATAMLAIASGQFSSVGQALWQHGGVIVWSLLVLLVEFRTQGRPSRVGTLVQGFACGMLPACRLSAATFLVPFGLWVFARSRRRALAIAGVAALTCLPWALGYWAIYGSPFGPSTNQMGKEVWSSAIGWPLMGVLLSPARGMVLYQPWVALALLAFLPAPGRGRRLVAPDLGCGEEPKGWTGFCAVVIILQVGLIAAWSMWWGGWCWGSRLVSEVLPLLALLAVRPIAALGRSVPGRRLVLTLTLAGFLMQVPFVYLGAIRWNELADVDHHPEALWSWSRAPFLLPIVGEAPR
jgi:hypothetical protein